MIFIICHQLTSLVHTHNSKLYNLSHCIYVVDMAIMSLTKKRDEQNSGPSSTSIAFDF